MALSETTDHHFIPSGADGFPKDLTQLGNYQLDRVVADGGMARVFMAQDVNLGRQIAVKVMRRSVGESSEFRDRFKHEIDLLVSFDIEGVVDIYDWGEEGGWIWYAMPYIKGITLKQYLQEHNPPMPTRLKLAERIARSLAHLHASEVSHRDLKPDNILVTDKDLTYIIDFGISKQMSLAEQVTQTRTRTTPGTPLYMAPELLLEESSPIDTKANDVYALGLICYELLTGSFPLGSRAATLPQHVNRLRDHEIEPAGTLNPALPGAACQAVMGALCKSPDQRIQAQDLADALSSAIHEATFMLRSGEHAVPPVNAALPQAAADGVDTKRQNRWKVRPVLVLSLAIILIAYGLSYYALDRVLTEPFLSVSAYLDGLPVNDATILLNGEPMSAGKTIRLESGEKYVIEARHVDGETVYMSKQMTQSASWTGRQVLGLDLEHVTEVVPGRDWRVPGLALHYQWFPPLDLWVGKHEVSNAAYRQKVPDHKSGEGLNGDHQPVVNVDFEEMVAFARWLTKREHEKGRLREDLCYRLPTTTEWGTFAARDAEWTYPWGNVLKPGFGNYYDETASGALAGKKLSGYTDGFVLTCPVELSGQNTWGLYGVAGNVFEACSTAESANTFGAWRGGSYRTATWRELQISYEGKIAKASDQGGFRLVIGPALSATQPPLEGAHASDDH